MIEITDLKKEYTLNGRKKYALDGISVKIPEGCFVSVIGSSGAGKSTLLRSMAERSKLTEKIYPRLRARKKERFKKIFV